MQVLWRLGFLSIASFDADPNQLRLMALKSHALRRSPAWPELKEQETNDRGSTTHLIWAVGDPKGRSRVPNAIDLPT
jgi:hypothetical protein